MCIHKLHTYGIYVLTCTNKFIYFPDSQYNCSDHHAIITDSEWTMLCPPTEEVTLQSLSINSDEQPVSSPFEEIGILTTYVYIHNLHCGNIF